MVRDQFGFGLGQVELFLKVKDARVAGELRSVGRVKENIVVSLAPLNHRRCTTNQPLDSDTVTSLKKEALQLLFALVRCYPKATTALGWNFLIEESAASLLVSSNDVEVTSLSLQVFIEFVKTRKCVFIG